jgi:broad specificity phosphatase PhoE
VQAVVEACEARGVPLPEPEVEPALDEYPALSILKRAAEGPVTGSTVREAIGLVMRRYVRGELAYDDVETFARFRERVGGFLDRVHRECGRGQIIAAFTSGGPVAAAIGQILDLTSEKVLELTWTIRNCGITELLFRPDRDFSLATFNGHPHLDESRLLTFR